jgi:hypothetical protein
VINRFRVVSTLITAIVALCQYLLLPSNIRLFGEGAEAAHIVIGAIPIVLMIVSNALPSWNQAPAASRAVGEAEALPPRG